VHIHAVDVQVLISSTEVATDPQIRYTPYKSHKTGSIFIDDIDHTHMFAVSHTIFIRISDPPYIFDVQLDPFHKLN